MFTVLRPFLRLPPEPDLPLTWYENRFQALALRGPEDSITHGLCPHPLTQQHGVGSHEAVEAWNLWAEKVGNLYSPSELHSMLGQPQRELDEVFCSRIRGRLLTHREQHFTPAELEAAKDGKLDALGGKYGLRHLVYTP